MNQTSMVALTEKRRFQLKEHLKRQQKKNDNAIKMKTSHVKQILRESFPVILARITIPA